MCAHVPAGWYINLIVCVCVHVCWWRWWRWWRWWYYQTLPLFWVCSNLSSSSRQPSREALEVSELMKLKRIVHIWQSDSYIWQAQLKTCLTITVLLFAFSSECSSHSEITWSAIVMRLKQKKLVFCFCYYDCFIDQNSLVVYFAFLNDINSTLQLFRIEGMITTGQVNCHCAKLSDRHTVTAHDTVIITSMMSTNLLHLKNPLSYAFRSVNLQEEALLRNEKLTHTHINQMQAKYTQMPTSHHYHGSMVPVLLVACPTCRPTPPGSSSWCICLSKQIRIKERSTMEASQSNLKSKLLCNV